MRMLKENFMIAISEAIAREEERNAKLDRPFESGFLQGLREVLRAAQRGEEIVIRDT